MVILIENPSSPQNSKKNDIFFTWNGYEENESTSSLLKIIESDEDYYKNKYLKWLYQVGEFRIKGKRIIDHLTFKDGLSYWWMSIFIEKDPWRDTSIMDVLRLMAFEKVLKQNKPSHVKIVTNNPILKNSIEILCKRLKIEFICEKETFKVCQLNNLYKRFYNFLPAFIRALHRFTIYFKKILIFQRSTKKELFSKNSIFFFFLLF